MTYLIIAGSVIALAVMLFVLWTLLKIAAITDEIIDHLSDK